MSKAKMTKMTKVAEMTKHLDSTEGLQRERHKRKVCMEQSVRTAIASIVNSGKTPSFYNVAKQAQIARSTLYRNPKLRELVESARQRSRGSSQLRVDSYFELIEENDRLRDEISRLNEKIDGCLLQGFARYAAVCSESVHYAIVDFPVAA